MRCLSCEYDLSHLTEHRCPECGREFDPDDVHTFDLPLHHPLVRDIPKGIGLAILATMMILTILITLWFMGLLPL